MPWIDPEAETTSWMRQEGAVYASGPEIIRRRGGNPRDVLAQEERWRASLKRAGIEQQLSTGGGGQQSQQATVAQPPQPSRKGAA
jgi:capsid protein